MKLEGNRQRRDMRHRAWAVGAQDSTWGRAVGHLGDDPAGNPSLPPMCGINKSVTVQFTA